MKVARVCLEESKHLVTASYTCKDMQNLSDMVKEKNLIFMNEIGLDPGLDHLNAYQMLTKVPKNASIKSFEIWCGGLPRPEACDNVLGYKFSWSPKGVLRALLSHAKYKKDGKIVNLTAQDVLLSATKIIVPHKGFNFEGYPNRDSTEHATRLGLQECDTFIRGTLRYQVSMLFCKVNSILLLLYFLFYFLLPANYYY